MGLLADIFNQDAFSLFNMTEAVLKLPQQATKLGDMGLFTVKSVATTTASVEEFNGVLQLVQTQVRGTRTNEMPHGKRKIRAFPIPHLPTFDTVKADEILGIREFGAGSSLDTAGSSDVNSLEQTLRTISTILNNRQQVMKNSLEVTKEWHRVTAIQGATLDADGSTLYDWFAEFGLTQQTFTFNFTSGSTDVKVTCQQICRKMIQVLGNTPYTGIQIICGDTFWDAFIANTGVKDAYRNYASNTMMQTQQRNGFMFADCYWMNYTAFFGNTPYIPTSNAFVVPLGVPNLFSEIYAPANFIEAVNTPGKPFYSKQLVLPYEVGIEIHMQTNPLMIPNRPGVLFKCSYT